MRDVATFDPNAFLDGIAVHPRDWLRVRRGRGPEQVVGTRPGDRASSTFADDAGFDDGFSKSGLTFFADVTTLFYSVGETGHEIRAIGGFPAVPEPLSLPVCGLAAAGSCLLRPARSRGPRRAPRAPLAIAARPCR